MGSDVAAPEEKGQELAISADEQALADRVKGRIDQTKLTLPALKVLNGTSSDVGDGLNVGDLVNSLTRENYGSEVEVVLCAMFEGRFLSINDGEEAFSARGDIVPSNWPEEYAGKRFTDLPDIEENYKAAVNAGEHEWGDGPPISTTHNFVVITADQPGLPLRLSLMRSNVKTASKVYTLLAAAKTPWDRTFVFSAAERTRGSGTSKYFGIDVKQGSLVTDPELRSAAVKTATAFAAAEDADAVDLHGDEDAKEKPAKPKERKGGLGVD